MTECQRLFLVQAQSDFALFELLETHSELHECHALHYLQMSTEMLGKALAWKHGRPGNTHRAFASFLRSLRTNRKAQKQLGFEGKNASWEHLIRKSLQLAERIEDLAPSLSPNSPNPEYPWPMDEPEIAPVEHTFELWLELQETPAGRQFLKLTRRLFATAEAYL